MSVKTSNPSIGTIFGRLTVMSPFESKGHLWYATCRCSCGTEKVFLKGNLLSGRSSSCGCFLKERTTTHGLAREPIYDVWQNMKQRCQVPAHKQYSNYGGRGIKVADDWQTFEGFYKDMGNRPFEGAMLERVDNDGPYSRENCVWADSKAKNNNKRNTVLWEYKGKKLRLAELVELSGLDRNVLSKRLYRSGWSVERTVETPITPHCERHNSLPSTTPAVRHKLYPASPSTTLPATHHHTTT